MLASSDHNPSRNRQVPARNRDRPGGTKKIFGAITAASKNSVLKISGCNRGTGSSLARERLELLVCMAAPISAPLRRRGQKTKRASLMPGASPISFLGCYGGRPISARQDHLIPVRQSPKHPEGRPSSDAIYHPASSPRFPLLEKRWSLPSGSITSGGFSPAARIASRNCSRDFFSTSSITTPPLFSDSLSRWRDPQTQQAGEKNHFVNFCIGIDEVFPRLDRFALVLVPIERPAKPSRQRRTYFDDLFF